MALTRNGWVTLIGSMAAFVAGRVLGLPEFYAIGAVCMFLVAVCAAWVALRKIDLTVGRRITPHRVHAGNTCTVNVDIRNNGVRTTPVLRVFDPVSGTAGADLLVASIGLRATTTAAYRLPTRTRGIVKVGPMRLEVTDPFGLVTSRLEAAPEVEVTVLPRLENVTPMPRTIGPEPDGGAERASALGRHGEDFAALRPYVVGDDLRRVHWPSSARSDDLLVRQDDVPWQGRMCVVLDVRREHHDADTIERAVSAAASILRAHERRGDHVRLVATDGTDSGYGQGAAHLSACFEYLAVATRSPRGTLRDTLEVVERGATGALVLITGLPTDADVDGVSRLSSALPVRRIVRLDRGGRTTIGRRTDVIGVEPGAEFGPVWSGAVPAGTTRARRSRRTPVASGGAS